VGLVVYIIAGVAVLAVVLSLAGVILGIGAGALWWATAVYHAFKPSEPPTQADKDWDRDQGRVAR